MTATLKTNVGLGEFASTLEKQYTVEKGVQ